MTKWRARMVVAALAIAVTWLFVAGGWWRALIVPVVLAMTVVEARWAERWPSRSSS